MALRRLRANLRVVRTCGRSAAAAATRAAMRSPAATLLLNQPVVTRSRLVQTLQEEGRIFLYHNFLTDEGQLMFFTAQLLLFPTAVPEHHESQLRGPTCVREALHTPACLCVLQRRPPACPANPPPRHLYDPLFSECDHIVRLAEPHLERPGCDRRGNRRASDAPQLHAWPHAAHARPSPAWRRSSKAPKCGCLPACLPAPATVPACTCPPAGTCLHPMCLLQRGRNRNRQGGHL